MNKTEFSTALRRALGKLPSYEVEQSIAFYEEMIDDRMEDGMSEQDAVAAMGPVSVIAAQIIAETPPIPRAIAKANTGNRTMNIVLWIVLSPIWFPLAVAFAATVFSIYVALWAVLVSLWMCVIAFLLCAPLGIGVFVWCMVTGFPLTGFFELGVGLCMAGVGIFAWFGMLSVSKGLLHLTRSFPRWVKSLFVKVRGKEFESDAASQAFQPAGVAQAPCYAPPETPTAHTPPVAPAAYPAPMACQTAPSIPPAPAGYPAPPAGMPMQPSHAATMPFPSNAAGPTQKGAPNHDDRA